MQVNINFMKLILNYQFKEIIVDYALQVPTDQKR